MEQDRAPAAPTVSVATAPCVECGRTFPVRDMLQYGQYHVCAEDKPVFQQKLAEGAFNPAKMVYAGFWIRCAALFIDTLIFYLVMIPITMLTVARGSGVASLLTSGLTSLVFMGF